MSYARLSKNSGVYVYLANSGYLTCCGCALDSDDNEYDPHLFSTADMINHLVEHVNEGHEVPQSCFEALLADQLANDKWMADPTKELIYPNILPAGNGGPS